MSFRSACCLLGLLLLGLLAPPALRAQTYVDTLDPPGDPALWGLTFHDGFLYAVNTNPDQLLRIDPATGATTLLGALAFDPRGLAWDGTNYRISTGFDTSSPLIYTVSPTGTTLGQIPAPSALTHGLTLYEGRLFAAKAYPDNEASLVGLDPATGAVLETIPFPSTQPGGIAFVDTNTLWTDNVGDDSGSSGVEVLWKLDRTTGAVLDTLAIPDGTQRPRGLAYDGARYLYVVMRQDALPFEYLIYKVDLQTQGNPVLALSDEAFDFGERPFGQTYTNPLTLFNTGDGPLDITNVRVEGPDAGVFSTSLAPATIPAGQSLAVQVAFSPTVFGPRTATLVFETNDVQNPVVSIPLRGVGLYPQQALGFDAANHDFGPIRIEPGDGERSSALWTLGLVNEGAQPLTVTGLTYSDDAFSTFEGALPLTVAPYDTALVRIEFRPTEVRPYAATASVASDDPAAPTRTVALTGEGINPALDGGDVVWAHTVPTNPATSSSDRKVYSLKSMGDVTGDGVPDLVYAARNYLVVALDGNGWGEPDTLWTFNTCPNNFDCGAVDGSSQLHETGLEAGRDFNGDGVGDVVFGTGGGNDAVVTLDGRTGDVIWQINSTSDPYLAAYSSVSARYDLNSDGIPEVVTGTGSADLANSPNPYNHRRVYMMNGATGAVLWEQQTTLPNFRTVILAGGDFGKERVVTGGGEGGSNFLRAYFGGGGAPVWTIQPSYTPFVIEPYRRPSSPEEIFIAAGLGSLVQLIDRGGNVLWTAGSMGSSVWDVAVLEGDPTDYRRVVVGSTRPDVVCLDGQTGNEVWQYTLGDQVFDVAAVPDIDGDFVDEVAATGKSGRTVLLNGASGALIWEHTFGNGSFDQSGEVVIGLPDVDGNGVPEVAFGTRDGRVRLLFGGGPTVPTAEAPTPEAPTRFALDAAYPNPFNPTTTLRFTLDATGPARLAVYDALGREVAVVAQGELPAGEHTARFDARGLASGVYLVRLEAGGRTLTQTVTLLK